MSQKVLLENNVDPDATQELEETGCCGGHGFIVCFFALFEGFSCLWLLITCAIFVGGATSAGGFSAGLIIFPAFGFFFHLVTQCILFAFDPGRVIETLRSLDLAIEDAAFAGILDELRGFAPQCKVHAEAYHTTSSGSGSEQTTTTHIDHVEEGELAYASWKDLSGRVAGLEKHKVVAVTVVPAIKCANDKTTASLANLHQRLKEKCSAAAPGRWTRSHEIVSVEHPKHPVQGSKVFVTRSTGAKHAGWLSSSTYTKIRFAFPFFGTIYRLVFFASVKTVQFKLSKEVSVEEERGPGWLKRHFGSAAVEAPASRPSCGCVKT